METVLSIAGGALGLVAGAALSYWVGGAISTRSVWLYRLGNGLLIVVGVVLAYVGLTQEMRWLAIGAIGLEAGGLTGLKYGYRT